MAEQLPSIPAQKVTQTFAFETVPRRVLSKPMKRTLRRIRACGGIANLDAIDPALTKALVALKLARVGFGRVDDRVVSLICLEIRTD